jgi:hypothetical protein
MSLDLAAGDEVRDVRTGMNRRRKSGELELEILVQPTLRAHAPTAGLT